MPAISWRREQRGERELRLRCEGQRGARTTSGTTSYLYDGANAAQELVGGSQTASVLAGGVDEVFQRTDGTGTRVMLTDALGGTVAPGRRLG
jgi:hypothetical protein